MLPQSSKLGRNRDRFPEDFAYQLTQQELTKLISQIATSRLGHGARRKLPWVFTEHGVGMLSSVLRSPTAVRVNIEIMRTFFVRLRRLMATPGELVEQAGACLAEIWYELHDGQIREIAQVLNKMMGRPGRAETPHRLSYSPRVECGKQGRSVAGDVSTINHRKDTCW